MEHNRSIRRREHRESATEFRKMGRSEGGRWICVNRGDFTARMGKKGGVIDGEEEGTEMEKEKRRRWKNKVEYFQWQHKRK